MKTYSANGILADTRASTNYAAFTSSTFILGPSVEMGIQIWSPTPETINAGNGNTLVGVAGGGSTFTFIQGGIYFITAQVSYPATIVGRVFTRFLIHANGYDRSPVSADTVLSASQTLSQTATAVVYATVGDTISLHAYQAGSSGTQLTSSISFGRIAAS